MRMHEDVMAETAPDLHFDDHGLRAGIWHGHLHGGAAPARLLLVLDGRVLAEAVPETDPEGGWHVAMPIPAGALGPGLRALVLLADTGPAGAAPGAEAQRLAALTPATGVLLEGDLQAEVALLRAELDLLKQVVRRLASR